MASPKKKKTVQHIKKKRRMGVCIEVGSTRGQVHNCKDSYTKRLYDLCSYRAFNYQFSEPYIRGVWDGFIRRFSSKTRTFPSGLLSRIENYFKDNHIDYWVKDIRRKVQFTDAEILRNIDEFGLILRPYQIDGLVLGLKNPYMIYWWATASGKTVLFASLIAALRDKKRFRQTLILVTNKDLAAQHREELGSMLGLKIGVIEEGLFDPGEVTVAVINTLWNLLVKKKNKRVKLWTSEIEHLIGDECHHLIDSKMMKQVINKCSGTLARHGFSGSPYSLTTDDMELEALTGPPLSKVTMSQLIRAGYISTPSITMVWYDSPYMRTRGSHIEVYNKGIVHCDIRNEAITQLVKMKYDKANQSILILIKIIEHGQLLSDLFIEAGIEPDDFVFISGRTHRLKRKEVKEDFKSGKLKIVIASQIWNEGIDVPVVDVLIKADGGGGKAVRGEKGVRSVIQQVGRVARKPFKAGSDVDREKASIVEVWDFVDNTHKDLARHTQNRINTYQLEKEFLYREISYDTEKGFMGKKSNS